MSQRSVLRFVSAPNGFGKSTLCAQYAELVFSFYKVFWIDCSSPCFIRDLDSGVLVSEIIQLCENPKLVVFDDFKNLDDDRSKMFSEVIDTFLDLKCEVIVNASPFNDGFIKYQNDSLILKSKDLLLSDKEINGEVKTEIERIPIVAWKDNYSVSSLIKCALTENFTDAILFSLFIIYLFEEESLDVLSGFLSKSDFSLLNDINNEYIYFGINENKDSFSVPHIFTSKLISLFNSDLQTLISIAKCTDRSDFAEKLCSLLEESNKNEKSLEVAKCLGNRVLQIETLTKFNEDSIRNLYLNTACSLFDKINLPKNNDGSLITFNALRLAILGNVGDAFRYSYSVLDNKNSTIDNMLLAALIFIRFGNTNEINQALKIIRHLNNDFKIDTFLNNENLSDEERFKCKVINRLIEVCFAIHSNSKNPFAVWNSNIEDELCLEDIICAELILYSHRHIKRTFFASDDFSTFMTTLSRQFNLDSKFDFNFYTFVLINTYLNEYEELINCSTAPLWKVNEYLKSEYLEYKKQFSNENKESGKYSSLSRVEHSNRLHANIDNSLVDAMFPWNKVPKLRINIFGGLSAFIGDREIISTNFGRQNIKLICCILALENGNEIGKIELAKLIWPDSDEECCRVNINSHWSIFRNLFVLENGDCPYIIKSQNSYKLAKSYFSSDLQDLESLCSDLTLGTLDSQAWWEAIEKNRNIVDGTLLPSETENAYIKQKRNEYKNKVVDALVAAAERLIDAGEIHQALWFAHKALSRDDSREDVFITLMKAQLKAGQRTPAIETYFACKKFLDEELGIEPSRQITDLYSRVVKETPV